MEKYPEVNWSEICRKAVIDYIDTRSHIEVAAILEKLKAEHNEAYKQGHVFFYQLAQSMSIQDFERAYPHISIEILTGREEDTFLGIKPLSREVAEVEAQREMARIMRNLCKDYKVQCPDNISDSFSEGATAAFMDIYSKVKPKKN